VVTTSQAAAIPSLALPYSPLQRTLYRKVWWYPKFFCGSFCPNLAVSQEIADSLAITISEIHNPIAKLISNQQMFDPFDRLLNLEREARH
jgi:hypothetical protein